jgi:hypothetical protein
VGIDATNPVSQLSVGDNGHEYAKASIYNSSTTNSHRAFRVAQDIGSNQIYGITTQIGYGTSGQRAYAIYGNAYRGSSPATSCRSIGVYGLGGNGIAGYNYGVYGDLIGDRNGTGIFGSDGTVITAIDGKYAGYFAGNVKIEDTLWVNSTQYTSDVTLKKDIRNLEDNVLSKLERLTAIKYKLKHPTELETFQKPDTMSLEYLQSDINSSKYTDDRIGLIAQDIQTVYPELVSVDNNGYLGVDYIGMIPILVEAIKEQQVQINDLTEEIEALRPSESNLKSENMSTSDINSTTNELLQNFPNPFNKDTRIEFTIAEESLESTIYLYDLQGSQIRSYDIQDRGKSSLTIYGSEFMPGMYLYTLVVDGQEIGTKRMVLTEM